MVTCLRDEKPSMQKWLHARITYTNIRKSAIFITPFKNLWKCNYLAKNKTQCSCLAIMYGLMCHLQCTVVVSLQLSLGQKGFRFPRNVSKTLKNPKKSNLLHPYLLHMVIKCTKGFEIALDSHMVTCHFSTTVFDVIFLHCAQQNHNKT